MLVSLGPVPDSSGTGSGSRVLLNSLLVGSVHGTGLHWSSRFLNPPPWIHMVDYRYVSPGVAKYLRYYT